MLENLSDGNNSGSQTDITVQPPHKLNVAVRFKSVSSPFHISIYIRSHDGLAHAASARSYFNGCDGQGASCNVPNCTPAPVSCQVDNVSVSLYSGGTPSANTMLHMR